MRLLVIGRGEGLLRSATGLRERGHDIVAMVTARPNDEYTAGPAEYAEVAQASGAYFFVGQRLTKEVMDAVVAARADVGISMNWVTILSPTELSSARLGILNAHFGDLPRYRGNAALNWAFLAGEPEVVLTVHQMIGGEIDVGDIRAQLRIPIGAHTYVGDVLASAYEALADLFAEAIGGLEGRVAGRQTVPPRIGFRTHPRLPSDGLIDWTRPALEIERLVRATSTPYPGAYTYFRDEVQLRRFSIWRAHATNTENAERGVPGQVIRIDESSGEVSILTGEGVLVIEMVSESGRDEHFQPAMRWRSTRMRLGMNIEDEIFRLAGRRANDD